MLRTNTAIDIGLRMKGLEITRIKAFGRSTFVVLPAVSASISSATLTAIIRKGQQCEKCVSQVSTLFRDCVPLYMVPSAAWATTFLVLPNESTQDSL